MFNLYKCRLNGFINTVSTCFNFFKGMVKAINGVPNKSKLFNLCLIQIMELTVGKNKSPKLNALKFCLVQKILVRGKCKSRHEGRKSFIKTIYIVFKACYFFFFFFCKL